MKLAIACARHRRGAALVLVLAFLVLISGLVLSYFLRTSTERQIANSSFQDNAAEILARSSLDIIVSDLKQEIADAPGLSASNVQPQTFGTPAAGSTAIPNLIRRSFSADPTARTSSVNSSSVSANGRSIGAARWNSHYLMPRGSAAATIDATPVTSFIPPDWVLVTADGPHVITSPSLAVIGRYAYTVFDEGGLLDLNIAGFPFSPATPASAATPGLPPTEVGRKGNAAFADLTALPTSPTVVNSFTSIPTSWHSASATNDIVGWRNYATVRPAGSFSNFTFDAATASAGTGSRFLNLFLDPSRSFLTVSNTTVAGRTEQSFVTRGELLKLRSAIGFSQNVLQYLGTFSRELNRPTSSALPARWPLGRFDVFGSTSPDAQAVQAHFGLKRVPAALGPPAVGEHWEYIGTAGTTRLDAIPEAISISVDSDLPSLLKTVVPVAATTGEILSIVASLIDQRDPDSETTWIEFGRAGSPQKAYGVDINPAVDPDPSPSPAPRPATPVVLNRAFRNVGEIGYAYRNASTPLDFLTPNNGDARLLDQFTFNTSPVRAGIVNLNTRNVAVLTALLTGTITAEPAAIASRTNSFRTAQSIALETDRQNATGRPDIARLAAASGTFFGASDEARKAVVRALTEVTQTRTWNLLIDVIAQSGRYPPSANTLADFVVQGEKRYWLHVAIDRFTGEIIDQQLEAVYE